MRVEMSPAPGECLLRYVGDRLRFVLRGDLPAAQAFLRTNIGRAASVRAEIIHEHQEKVAFLGSSPLSGPGTLHTKGLSWRDIPMEWRDDCWELDLALSEVGFFQGKAFLLDDQQRQYWPPGKDVEVTVHPNSYRSGNVIYCAFTRMFGESKTASETAPQETEPLLTSLDKQGYSVIPASGKFRDLLKEFPHIFDTLGCKILHLLPINPTPTTYARFGRFGSPYAVQDLLEVDPALVEFDRRTTGIEQFQELTYAVHARGGKVFLDMVINHTGWGSKEQENHPGWFLRAENGLFLSPGAWGTTWEDLVEIDHHLPFSWNYLAEVFLTWCRRGVDGFRCDAGYKVPTPAWRYIIARVREEFPDTLFLLEGLGGAWEATQDLLTRGGMQWAYSELFQNYSPVQVSGYMDHSIVQSERVGTLIHYSETHDNERLAKTGARWSLLRNRLCALASHNGGFGFTCGVEWLATEKISVHGSRGMAWGSSENIILELNALNTLLAEHPCFFDHAKIRRISPTESAVLALERRSADESERLLVLVNLDPANPSAFFLSRTIFDTLGAPVWDLLTASEIKLKKHSSTVEFRLAPAGALCLAPKTPARTLRGENYRRKRAQHAWAIQMLASTLQPEQIGPHDWVALADLAAQSPARFLGTLGSISPADSSKSLLDALQAASAKQAYPCVIQWTVLDRRRVTPVPPGHWLLIENDNSFRATLVHDDREVLQPPSSTALQPPKAPIRQTAPTYRQVSSVEMNGRHYAAFAPQGREGHASLYLERYQESERHIAAELFFLPPLPNFSGKFNLPPQLQGSALLSPVVLLTNGIGGMARICVDLGSVKSKYDCVLGANLHPTFPVDRHIFVKRIRVWANAQHFITPLNAANLRSFHPGPPARWEFEPIAGDQKTVRIRVTADMLPDRNTTVFKCEYLPSGQSPALHVSLTVRLDIEDRNFHTQTKHNSGAEFHFSAHTHLLQERPGFLFAPAQDRQLHAFATAGRYHPAPEWSWGIPHPVEQTRGQVGSGDAYSPGWFELPLLPDQPIFLVMTADLEMPDESEFSGFETLREQRQNEITSMAALNDPFGGQLAKAARAFVVRRDECKTIIAGYPWFLDWGRDTLICARGLLAAGMLEEVQQMLIAFGRFEKEGTLPNTIHGADASNRDTTDAPLWYAIVCEELAALMGPTLYDVRVEPNGRTILDVLRSIVTGYRKGTANGIHMDPASGLIWSPAHFTWMDTNYPAGTPREGYPVEIQALWIKLVQQLERLGVPSEGEPWKTLADRALNSFGTLFWLEHKGWLSDVLLAKAHTPAQQAVPDDALRSNCIIPLLFDLVPKERARACIRAVQNHLVIPGALRSLAPLRVSQPLAIHGPDWRLLNDPYAPYAPRYEGDEDTQRKPAYHNGTAWTWTFPGFCEALARLWDFSPEATQAATAYLGSMNHLLDKGCLGQIPEILDGDVPHLERGCDAQSWGVTEALRVWKLLKSRP